MDTVFIDSFKKLNVKRITILGLLSLALLMAGGCKDKKNDIFLLLGSASSLIGNSGETPAQGDSTPTTQTGIGGDDADASSVVLNLPADTVNTGTTPEGDFDGVTFQGEDNELSGFISIITNGNSADAAALVSTLLGIINGQSGVNASVISNQQAAGDSDTVLLQITIHTDTGMTVTELSNLLIELIGANTPTGTVTSLPTSQAGESTDDDFRVVIQVTFQEDGGAVIGVGVSTEDNFDDNESILTGILDGTNIGDGGQTVVSGSLDFTGTGAPKADILFAVDNSGSMRQEQSAVQSVATSFFDRMTETGLDFQVGVITSDSSNLAGDGFTSDKSTFMSDVIVGTSGSGIESNIFYTEKALTAGSGSVINAGYPRADASLTVVMISDEGDHYSNKAGSAFNFEDNLFLTNGYRVFSIIGLDDSGQPGTCLGSNGTKAGAGNNTNTSYYDLSQKSGGAASSICNSDYSAFLDIIAVQAGAAASSYNLGSIVPISTSLAVTVNGVTVSQSSSNGFIYSSVTNSLVFTGSAIPPVGANIVLTYNRYE